MIFVYYSDDYYNNGGVGLERFATREEAASFIQKRISFDLERKITDYTVIEGSELKVAAVETATRIRLEPAAPRNPPPPEDTF